MIQYAVMIEVDGDRMYIPENTHGFLTFIQTLLDRTMLHVIYNAQPELRCMWDCQDEELSQPSPKLFSSKEEAEEEAVRWNTGIVVNYTTHEYLSFTQEERKAAMKRIGANIGEYE